VSDDFSNISVVRIEYHCCISSCDTVGATRSCVGKTNADSLHISVTAGNTEMARESCLASESCMHIKVHSYLLDSCDPCIHPWLTYNSNWYLYWNTTVQVHTEY
jgi:hypothetical protein